MENCFVRSCLEITKIHELTLAGIKIVVCEKHFDEAIKINREFNDDFFKFRRKALDKIRNIKKFRRENNERV